jgi:hypothetical protein
VPLGNVAIEIDVERRVELELERRPPRCSSTKTPPAARPGPGAADSRVAADSEVSILTFVQSRL